MEHNEIALGSIVTAINKTGKYIGEVTDIREQSYLVKILAVLKHPMQGDLHNPKQVEVTMFHARRALAYREQTNVPKKMVKPYHDEVPHYLDSLRSAVGKIKEELSANDSPWNKKSLEMIDELEKDYFK